jgi:ornithine cyclodeaminase/alanine dehydrogenase-like protein (mu-crystallin family)
MVVKIAGGGFKGHGSSGLMAVFSQTTGVLEGILQDNGWLTDLRTAAAREILSFGVSRFLLFAEAVAPFCI